MYFCGMFQLGKTIVTEDLLEKDFVCNISKCKGICCVAGEAGAPLEKEEVQILEGIYPTLKPYLRQEGIEAIEVQGTSVVSDFGELETPLVNGSECVYVVFDENKTAHCGIEQAYNDGKVNWKKPISCHLYPVRVKDYSEFAAVNYHSWDICNDACTLGKELKVPVYEFVKEALVRKFGEDWYSQLEKAADEYHST